jgi:nitrate/nitrite-specific signal transduction histidine kinase
MASRAAVSTSATTGMALLLFYFLVIAASGEVKSQVLKIAREALYNVYTHLHATHVLFSMERKNGDLHLSIDDNGHGYDFSGSY